MTEEKERSKRNNMIDGKDIYLREKKKCIDNPEACAFVVGILKCDELKHNDEDRYNCKQGVIDGMTNNLKQLREKKE